MTVAWEPWSTVAFDRARAEGKPVLLSIVAPWCAASAEMLGTTYADPRVLDLLAAHFVSIRVDADRRPDIGERYALGGYPTTAFLDADGALVGGGTFLPVERMREALTRTVAAFASHRHQTRDDSSSVADATPKATTVLSDDDLTAQTFAGVDDQHGGFGSGPKFPLTAPIELALGRYRRSRDARMAAIAETTLDAMGWGPLYDDIDGGFFRFAEARDWRAPHREKLLDVNAALLRLYIEASTTLKIARYAERAADVVRYVQTHLADQADGGWAGSQAGDDAYYTLSGDHRRGRPAPTVDWTFYSGANAAMASAMLQAAAVLEDPALGEFAVRSLERVLLAAYRPGEGVAHYVEDGRAMVRGLLDDQIAMVSAQLDAYEATGNVVYEMMAQELAHYALRMMWDEAAGGFFDRAEADESERVGLMAERLKPFVANCDAARALRRLARATGEREFERYADLSLRTVLPLAGDQGPLAAHYLLARADG